MEALCKTTLAFAHDDLMTAPLHRKLVSAAHRPLLRLVVVQTANQIHHMHLVAILIKMLVLDWLAHNGNFGRAKIVR